MSASPDQIFHKILRRDNVHRKSIFWCNCCPHNVHPENIDCPDCNLEDKNFEHIFGQLGMCLPHPHWQWNLDQIHLLHTETEKKNKIRKLLWFKANMQVIYDKEMHVTFWGVLTHPWEGSGIPFLGIPLKPGGQEHTGSAPCVRQIAFGPQASCSVQGS